MSRHALRFFMTELLYKTLREEEPMPELFDYVVGAMHPQSPIPAAQLPITFMLSVSRHMGIEPLDNYSPREPLFDMLAGRYQYSGEHTLDGSTSLLLHHYLQAVDGGPTHGTHQPHAGILPAAPCRVPQLPVARNTPFCSAIKLHYNN